MATDERKHKQGFRWHMENSSTVATTARWFPFSESGAPTDLQLDNYRPFRALRFENLSGEAYDVILDPTSATEGVQEFRVPDGTTLTISFDDQLYFSSIIAINQGSLTTAATELKLTIWS